MKYTTSECGADLSGVELSSAVPASKPYANCRVGDHFFFGSYPQGQNGEVKPIEWRVLARKSDRLLVLAEYGLDWKTYNEEWVDITWSQCTLRTWLNGEFMNKAFTLEERGSLLEVSLCNTNSLAYWRNVLAGPNTRDKVFLLSMDEAKRYFRCDAERCCKATAYAVQQGTRMSGINAYACNCRWWLRSPICRAHGGLTGSIYSSNPLLTEFKRLVTRAAYAAVVCDDGRFGNDGEFCYDLAGYGDGAVRPAAFLAL